LPDLNESTYFKHLSDAWNGIRVADGVGMEISLDEGIDKSLEILEKVASAGKKAMLVANGGSAAIVSHMQNDLCKAVGVRAIVFNEAPLLTALSNDNSYETAFEYCVQLWGEEGDLLFAISSSGRSENILRSVSAAQNLGCNIITFSGFEPDNPLRGKGSLNFYVPSGVYGHVELTHGALSHFMTDRAMTMDFGL